MADTQRSFHDTQNNNINNESWMSRVTTSPHFQHLFLPTSTLTPQQQQIRRRILLSITITLVIILVHVLIIIIFFSSYNKYGSNQEQPNPIPNPNDPANPGDQTEEDKKRRTLFTYMITLPNLLFLFCMSCCVCTMCTRRIFVKYLQTSSSSTAQYLRQRLRRAGIHVGEPTAFNSDQLLQDLDSSDGSDLYRLQLAMVDRDFDENDYEALLMLDETNTARNRQLTDHDMKRLLISYKIPHYMGHHNADTIVDMNDDDFEDNGKNGLLSAYNNEASDDIVEKQHEENVDYCTVDEAQRLIEKQCVICLEDYRPGDVISHIRTCPHEFHQKCITEALKVKPICPICKVDAV